MATYLLKTQVAIKGDDSILSVTTPDSDAFSVSDQDIVSTLLGAFSYRTMPHSMGPSLLFTNEQPTIALLHTQVTDTGKALIGLTQETFKTLAMICWYAPIDSNVSDAEYRQSLSNLSFDELQVASLNQDISSILQGEHTLTIKRLSAPEREAYGLPNIDAFDLVKTYLEYTNLNLESQGLSVAIYDSKADVIVFKSQLLLVLESTPMIGTPILA